MTEKTPPAESGGAEDIKSLESAIESGRKYMTDYNGDDIRYAVLQESDFLIILKAAQSLCRRAEPHPASLADAIGHLDNIAHHSNDCRRDDENAWNSCDCEMAVAFQCISRALREPQPASNAGKRADGLADRVIINHFGECHRAPDDYAGDDLYVRAKESGQGQGAGDAP